MSELILTEKPPVKHDWSKEDYAEYRRKVVRECQKRRRAKAKAQGMCSICCKRPVVIGYQTCSDCYLRVRIWQAKQKYSNYSQP